MIYFNRARDAKLKMLGDRVPTFFDFQKAVDQEKKEQIKKNHWIFADKNLTSVARLGL